MRVYADENGVQALTRAESCPSLNENTLNCLSTKFRGPLDPLVRNIATRVYNKRKAQIGADILRDARKTINNQFDENAAQQFADANGKYGPRCAPLVKRGIFPQHIKVLCSDTELGVRALLNDPTGKGRALGRGAVDRRQPPSPSAWKNRS